MFSLVVSIIGILLVAVLSAAAIYYMGDSTHSAKSTGDLARVINEASQIHGAVLLREQDKPGVPLTAMTQLLDEKYLVSAPSSDWNISPVGMIRPVTSIEQCMEFNKRHGYSLETPPSCSDEAYVRSRVCCLIDATAPEGGE